MKRKNLKMPTHIAFIMDGNRRWAQARGLSKNLGHRQGGIALKNLVDVLAECEGIKYASFFAFSTENWKRSKEEIDYIFNVARNFIEENEQKFMDKNIKFVAMGDLSNFPQDLVTSVRNAEERTKNNTGLVVNLALGYGGREDIVQAANKVFKSGKELTEKSLSENLLSYPAPDIDLLIRTSGEERVSNFMLFQLAYSEFYFTKTFWPDFGEKQLEKALIAFTKRNRRFGGN